MDPITHRALQLNPNNLLYWTSRGLSSRPAEWASALRELKSVMTPEALRNYSMQLNPNNVRYWLSRGFNSRPDNWAELTTSFKFISPGAGTGNTVLKTCLHGTYRMVCWLCSAKSLMLLGAVMYLYMKHKEQLHEYSSNAYRGIKNAGSASIGAISSSASMAYMGLKSKL